MATYLVTWEIDIESENPKEAAEQALEIMQDKESEALTFNVLNQKSEILQSVDLLSGDIITYND